MKGKVSNVSIPPDTLGYVTRVTQHETTATFRELLEDVKKLLKTGESHRSLLDKVIELRKIVDQNSEALRRSDELHYLKAKAFISEVYDYFGDTGESRQVVQEGAKLYNDLPETADSYLSPNQRQILREKIRVCLSWANAEFYRTDQFQKAEAHVRRIRRLVDEGLSDDEYFPCFGTKGQINYYLGRIYRQLGRLDEAEMSFNEAIEFYYSRAEQKKKEFKVGTEKADLEVRFSNHRIAICLGLGVGWVNYTRGHLTKALSSILTARMLLLTTNDEFNKASLDLLLGAIRRSLAPNTKGMHPALSHAKKAYDIFRRDDHQRYLARAAYSLSLTHFYGKDYSAATNRVLEVMKIAEELEDYQWLANSLTLQSRIKCALKDYNAAEKDASLAYKLATDHYQVLSTIEALIARSQVWLEMRETAAARKDLQEAIYLNGQASAHHRTAETANPRIQGLYCLNLAYSYALDNDSGKAGEAYDSWLRISAEIEDRRVHDRADEVDLEIKRVKKDFVIKSISKNSTPDPKDFNYRDNLVKMQKHLVAQAKVEHSKKEDIAEFLGIQRQTLFKWEKQWSGKPKRQKKGDGKM
jgi:tetratricopeptide (TPR) repeat protein